MNSDGISRMYWGLGGKYSTSMYVCTWEAEYIVQMHVCKVAAPVGKGVGMLNVDNYMFILNFTNYASKIVKFRF